MVWQTISGLPGWKGSIGGMGVIPFRGRPGGCHVGAIGYHRDGAPHRR
jgi:hypothetical protein